jgi:putative drug exporter of the RND superfamily
VDYALLVVSRFREERRTATDVPAAIAATAATAGRTVGFSGLTVAVALAGLVVFPDPFLRSMGLAGVAVVLVDMAAAVTLLPALLALAGRWISPAKPPTGGGVFARLARAVQHRPLLTLLAAGATMLVLAAPLLGLRISEGDPRMLPASTETRQLWDRLGAHFPEQAGPGDIQVVADTTAGDPALARHQDAIAALPGVSDVDARPAGPALTALNATPSAPAEDPAAQDTVAAIRALPAPFGVEVTGEAARLVDYRAMLAERLPWALALVLAGTLGLLFAFTGSVVLPVKAVATKRIHHRRIRPHQSCRTRPRARHRPRRHHHPDAARPATMTLLGERNWWLPRPLQRIHTRLAPAHPARIRASPIGTRAHRRTQRAGCGPSPTRALGGNRHRPPIRNDDRGAGSSDD